MLSPVRDTQLLSTERVILEPCIIPTVPNMTKCHTPLYDSPSDIAYQAMTISPPGTHVGTNQIKAIPPPDYNTPEHRYAFMDTPMLTNATAPKTEVKSRLKYNSKAPTAKIIAQEPKTCWNGHNRELIRNLSMERQDNNYLTPPRTTTPVIVVTNATTPVTITCMYKEEAMHTVTRANTVTTYLVRKLKKARMIKR